MSCEARHPDGRHQMVRTRRRLLHDGLTIAGVAILAASGCASSVGQQLKIPRLGLVSPFAGDADFIQVLGRFGYIDGQNIAIEFRTAPETPAQLTPLVEELVRLPADIIVAVGSTAAKVAKAATRTIPILFFAVADAVAFGLVASLARPEGNVTGITNYSHQVIAKGLEYLVQLAPGVARIAFVGNLGGNPGSPLQLAAAKTAAATIGVQIVEFELRDAGDIDRVFESFSASGVKAVLVGSDAITNNQPRLVELAARYRLPAMYSRREFAVAGGLIAHGPNYPALWDRLAALIDKIVRGKALRDLPVEQPTKFDLVVNAKTARALGITVPPAILMQAEVIP